MLKVGQRIKYCVIPVIQAVVSLYGLIQYNTCTDLWLSNSIGLQGITPNSMGQYPVQTIPYMYGCPLVNSL